ncbi:4Fe-4S binding protein [Pontiella sulfatireligans]|uniref:4Fe-4S ferredoxin-type domain-containing protein n=1 Tax=Pontiella sulfatireligans TaxID=2750658 RepID=A0A6C2UPJ5_9BACT|nr:4Fe-4S binding protein [Pontiella sulfatireligans]VGO22195.1 hypothetical protein SCARR_04277 [Pontiella sulfatireligans]
MDVLSGGFIRRLFGAKWFPRLFQWIALLVFGLIIWGAWGANTHDLAFAKILRNTNLSCLFVWSYWWPAMLLAVLFGRVWCMVCPLELVAALGNKTGLNRKVPSMLKSRWFITIAYGLILIAGMYCSAIHRVPFRMAVYLLLLFTMAVLAGLLFEKRAFCSYLCPISHLLRLYSCCAPLEWRTKVSSTCNACREKYQAAGQPIPCTCPSAQSPAALTDNRSCLLCTQCFKNCPEDNIRLSTRAPFKDFFQNIKLSTAELGFIVLVSAFVVYDIVPEWKVTKQLLMWLPDQIVNLLGLSGAVANYTEALVLFVGLPVLFFLMVVGIAKVFSKERAITLANSFGLLLLPTIACTHMVKGLFKAVSRVPYISMAISDPNGVQTATEIYENTAMVDKSALAVLEPMVNVLWVIFAMGALWATVLILKKSAAFKPYALGTKSILFCGAFAYWSLLALAIIMWRF